MPEDMSDRVPEDMPDRMPEDLPDRMPEDMPEDMPDHMPEDMPDRMPNRMSEDMSDRMPEDLPVRKCINVMVGITRSKVILDLLVGPQDRLEATLMAPHVHLCFSCERRVQGSDSLLSWGFMCVYIYIYIYIHTYIYICNIHIVNGDYTPTFNWTQISHFIPMEKPIGFFSHV